MSTHNIRFRGEIRKILCGYPLLSVAMKNMLWYSLEALHQVMSTTYVFVEKKISIFWLKKKKYI